MKVKPNRLFPIHFIVTALLMLTINTTLAQDNRIIRIAKIKIDSSYLQAYKIAVKEQIDAAISIEPGVLMLYAVHDKNTPTNVTVFEIYADLAAYKSHIETRHFKKYKTGTAHMVKALELTEVLPIELGFKAN